VCTLERVCMCALYECACVYVHAHARVYTSACVCVCLDRDLPGSGEEGVAPMPSVTVTCSFVTHRRGREECVEVWVPKHA